MSTETENDVVTVEKTKTGGPGRFACVLLNDDYTTMEFVIEVLVRFFKKSEDEAYAIMLSVHNKGKGVAGIYSYEIAETKASQVTEYAVSSKHPLQCIVEEV